MRKVYTGLVTAKPPREVPPKADAKPYDVALQEISSSDPTIMVPQDDSDFADRVRKLLLMDAAITPPNLDGAYGIPPWALDTARLGRALQASKLPLRNWCSLPITERETLEKAWQAYNSSPNQRRAAMMRLAAAAGVDFQSASYAFPKLDTWEQAIAFARSLAKQAEGEQLVQSPTGVTSAPSSPLADQGEGGDEESEKDERGSPGTGEIVVSSRGGEATYAEFLGNPWSKGHTPKANPSDSGPGNLINSDNPDKLPMEPRRKRGLRRRAEDTGTMPRSFERWHIDRKVFRGMPHQRGGMKGRGTVLVDMSSSMQWSETDFANMLAAMPECTVYGYCGSYKSGRWVLLADRGRVAKMSAIEDWRSRIPGGNVVDVPCLRKLGKMSKPRIWVSDAGATGANDDRSQYIIDLVAEACCRGEIVRVRYSEQAVEYLQNGKAKGAITGARAALMDV